MSVGYFNDVSIVFEFFFGVVNGDIVIFDLIMYFQVIGDSLFGIFSNLGIVNWQMWVVFEIEIGCGFDFIKIVVFYWVWGFSLCSDFVIGFDIVVVFNLVNVVGMEVFYEMQLVFFVFGVLQGCGSMVCVQVVFMLMGGSMI